MTTIDVTLDVIWDMANPGNITPLNVKIVATDHNVEITASDDGGGTFVGEMLFRKMNANPSGAARIPATALGLCCQPGKPCMITPNNP